MHIYPYMICIIWFGLVWRSPKSAAEVTITMSLVWDFQKGISCRGKYALFCLVWWSPKSAAEVTIAMSLVWHYQKGTSCRGKYALFGLVWFGGNPNQLQRSPLQCPWSGIFKKVYHVGVNIDYLGCLHWRLQLEVTMISCRGHPNQLQRSPLHCP